MEIWNVWHASDLLAGVVKGVTAGVSVVTASRILLFNAAAEKASIMGARGRSLMPTLSPP